MTIIQNNFTKKYFQVCVPSVMYTQLILVDHSLVLLLMKRVEALVSLVSLVPDRS